MEQRITVKEWCEQYLAEREFGWSDVTRNSYRCIVGRHIVSPLLTGNLIPPRQVPVRSAEISHLEAPREPQNAF